MLLPHVDGVAGVLNLFCSLEDFRLNDVPLVATTILIERFRPELVTVADDAVDIYFPLAENRPKAAGAAFVGIPFR